MFNQCRYKVWRHLLITEHYFWQSITQLKFVVNWCVSKNSFQCPDWLKKNGKNGFPVIYISEKKDEITVKNSTKEMNIKGCKYSRQFISVLFPRHVAVEMKK